MRHKNTDNVLMQNIKVLLKEKAALEKNGVRDTWPNYKGISDALDEYYFLNKLKVYCTFLSHQRIMNSEHTEVKTKDFRLIKNITKQIKKNDFDNPTISVYFLIKTLLEKELTRGAEQDILFVQSIEKQLIENTTNIHPQDQMELYSILTSYCSKKINLGFDDYKPLFFKYNNEIINLKFGVLDNHSNITPAIFKNMVKIAILLADDQHLFQNLNTWRLKPNEPAKGFKDGWEWVEKFIELYYKKLDSKNELYYTYTQAYLLFKKKNFLEAYNLIGSLKRFQGVFINLDMKMLQLMVTYEIEEKDIKRMRKDEIDITKIRESYRKLIEDDKNRKLQLSYQLEIHNSFSNLFQRLYNLNLKYKGVIYNYKDPTFLSSKSALLKDIKKTPYSFKHWMLEKLEDL